MIRCKKQFYGVGSEPHESFKNFKVAMNPWHNNIAFPWAVSGSLQCLAGIILLFQWLSVFSSSLFSSAVFFFIFRSVLWKLPLPSCCILLHLRLYYELTSCWLDGSVGRRTAPVSQRSWVQIPFQQPRFQDFSPWNWEGRETISKGKALGTRLRSGLSFYSGYNFTTA